MKRNMQRNMQRIVAMLLVVLMTANLSLSNVAAQEVSADEETTSISEEVTDVVAAEPDEVEEPVVDEPVVDEPVVDEPATMSATNEDDGVAVISEASEADWEWETVSFWYGGESLAEGVALTKYIGEDVENIVVPDTINGEPVVSMGDSSTFDFGTYNNIKTITISDNIVCVYEFEVSYWETGIIVIASSDSEAFKNGMINTPFVLEGYESDFLYKFEEGYLAIAKCLDTTISELNLPTELLGVKIEAISSEAFYECTELQSAVLPDSIAYVNANALPDGKYFEITVNSEALKNETMYSKFYIAGSGIVYECNRTVEYEYDDNGDYVGETWNSYLVVIDYIYTSDEYIIMPGDVGGIPVTHIFSGVFQNCYNLVSVTLPDSIESVNWDVLPYNNSYFIVTENNTAYKNQNISEVFTIENDYFKYYFNKEYEFEQDDNGDWTSTLIATNLDIVGCIDTMIDSETLSAALKETDAKGISGGAFNECYNLGVISLPDNIEYVQQNNLPYGSYFEITEDSIALNNKELYADFKVENSDFLYKFGVNHFFRGITTT